MNLRTPYDVLCSSFYNNWRSHKEDCKDYTFDDFCDLLINDKKNCLMKGSLVFSIRFTCLRGRSRKTIRREDDQIPLVANMNVLIKKEEGKTEDSSCTWKNKKKKTLLLLWEGGTCGENLLEEGIGLGREG